MFRVAVQKPVGSLSYPQKDQISQQTFDEFLYNDNLDRAQIFKACFTEKSFSNSFQKIGSKQKSTDRPLRY